MATNHKKTLATLDASNTGNGVGLPPVLNTAKSVSHFLAETPAQQRRAQRYKLQRAAAQLLPGSRTAQCLWAVSSSYGVDIIANKPEGRARFSGLQTCGSVWSCPCCSGTVSEQRRGELNALLAWARAQGLHPVMLTLTARHDKDTQLRAQLDGMKNAKRRMVSNRTFVNLRPHLVGYVTATELTGGGFHGWHPHFHQIMLVKAASQTDALAKIEKLRGSWLSSLRAEGLDGEGAAFHLQGATAAGNYVGKWGAAEELTLGAAKQGRKGKTPFQLLSSFADDGDDRAGSLFAEYAKVFKGRRQLVWSPGLKKLARIAEVSDEQAAEDAVRLFEESKHDERVGHFTPEAWKKVRHVRAALLKFAELSGEAGVSAMVQAATGRPALPLPGRGVLGMGEAHGSEAKQTEASAPQMPDAVPGASTPSPVAARHAKPVSLPLAPSFGQCFADPVAFDSVQNDLAARVAKVSLDGFDDDIAQSDIAGVPREGVGTTTKALHSGSSVRGLKRAVAPFYGLANGEVSPKTPRGLVGASNGFPMPKACPR